MSLIWRIFLMIVIVSCAACSATDNKIIIKEAPVEIVCKLSNNVSDLGSIESLSVFDGGFAVISSPNKVFMYDMEGHQKCTIGHAGNARFEYNRPYIIRSDNDSLYIWSANSLKFIVYSNEGKPVSEYSYPSAIRDFIPTKDKIIIYNAGASYNNIIDIYSKKLTEVTDTLAESSDEHKVLLSRTSNAPMIYSNDCLLFASKDNLSVIAYNLNNHDIKEHVISSNSFSVDKIKSIAILQNRQQMSDYLMNNSTTVALIPKYKHPVILALEGHEAVDEANRIVDYTYRYYALYDVRSGNRLVNYSYESMAPMYLFSVYDDSLYFIRQEYDQEHEDESYYLCRLNISNTNS